MGSYEYFRKIETNGNLLPSASAVSYSSVTNKVTHRYNSAKPQIHYTLRSKFYKL